MIEWLKKMFGFGNHNTPAMQAIARSQRVGESLDRLNERLQPYTKYDDPFRAFIADTHSRAVERHLVDDERRIVRQGLEKGDRRNEPLA